MRPSSKVAARANPAVAGGFVSGLMAELERLPKPLGVFAENDDAATQVLEACFRLGLRVPEQVAVLGCDNDPLVADFVRVPMKSGACGGSARSNCWPQG